MRNVGKKCDIVDIKPVKIHIVLLCGILEYAICQLVLTVQHCLGQGVFDVITMAVVTACFETHSSFL